MEIFQGWLAPAATAPAAAPTTAHGATSEAEAEAGGSTAVSFANKVDAGEVAIAIEPNDRIDAAALRICTLNVGGRNTNSFEFMMAGDGSELG